ncbi:MAG: hypothetical protein AMXMBFR61_05400 [Fimbriimonadales bacterium]
MRVSNWRRVGALPAATLSSRFPLPQSLQGEPPAPTAVHYACLTSLSLPEGEGRGEGALVTSVPSRGRYRLILSAQVT